MDTLAMPFVSYSKRKTISITESRIDLHEKYIEYIIRAKYEELSNETELWEDRLANERTSYLKKNICAVDIYYDNKEDKWSVGIIVKEDNYFRSWLFEEHKEATKVYDQLKEYILA